MALAAGTDPAPSSTTSSSSNAGPSEPHQAADPQSFPELDCLRGRLPQHLLAAAETRAERLGLGADRVLIASGVIDEESYVRALAEHLGLGFEPLDRTPRERCHLSDLEIVEKGADGILSLVESRRRAIVIAPRRLAARQLSRMGADARQAVLWRLTTSEQLNRFVLRSAGAILARQAVDGLRKLAPDLSAAPGGRPSHGLSLTVFGALAVTAFQPGLVVAAAEFLLGTMFLGWLALRLAGAVLPARRPAPLPPMRDEDLPTYTVIAALHREAASVDELLRALAALDYPREKLQVILALEADDAETQAAVARRTARLPVTVISVPRGAPQTKPRALNAALPFAQGAFTVVYDAEDRPDPDQLRRSLAVFASGGERLACVQARLTLDNTNDSFLTALFTAEYAGHFDVFLDGLSALLLPLPLGGSSNHFRTSILRKVGGWDAYNVTEDADLGLRLARFGYRTEMIASSTHEEAPAKLGPWLKQRTRWMKGWIQTWAVHMRSPSKLLRDLGPSGFAGVQLIILGSVAAALVHPVFLVALLASLATGDAPWQSDGDAILIALYLLNLFAGYIGSGVLGWIGLGRRGLRRIAWVLLLIPLHWLLLSLAAWRAVWQFARAPQLWEKTEHGLARHSRRNERTTAALIALEREISRLEREGVLPPHCAI